MKLKTTINIVITVFYGGFCIYFGYTLKFAIKNPVIYTLNVEFKEKITGGFLYCFLVMIIPYMTQIIKI